MRFPQPTSAVDIFIDLMWYLICALRADPETLGMDVAAQAALGQLKGALAARNEAKDMLVLTRAQRAVAQRMVDQWLAQVVLDANAAFGGKKQDLGYQRLLPKPRTEVMRQNVTDRRKDLDAILRAMESKETPAAVANHHAQGKKLCQALRVAEEGVDGALVVFGEKVHQIQVVRVAWMATYKSAHASLTLKYPLKPEVVESFFDDPPRASKKVVEAVAPVVQP